MNIAGNPAAALAARALRRNPELRAAEVKRSHIAEIPSNKSAAQVAGIPRIGDAAAAAESVRVAKDGILSDAAGALRAQAGQIPLSALRLLQ